MSPLQKGDRLISAYLLIFTHICQTREKSSLAYMRKYEQISTYKTITFFEGDMFQK